MMKKCHARVAALVMFAAGLAGCSTSPMSRIDANRAVYESWPVDIQSAVLDGKAVKGMTPEMVRMALGEPTRIDVRSGANASDEIWIYQKGGGMSSPLSNVSIGGGIGGIGIGTSGRRGGGSGGSGADEQDVVFQNGVVFRVD